MPDVHSSLPSEIADTCDLALSLSIYAKSGATSRHGHRIVPMACMSTPVYPVSWMASPLRALRRGSSDMNAAQ